MVTAESAFFDSVDGFAFSFLLSRSLDSGFGGPVLDPVLECVDSLGLVATVGAFLALEEVGAVALLSGRFVDEAFDIAAGLVRSRVGTVGGLFVMLKGLDVEGGLRTEDGGFEELGGLRTKVDGFFGGALPLLAVGLADAAVRDFSGDLGPPTELGLRGGVVTRSCVLVGASIVASYNSQ